MGEQIAIVADRLVKTYRLFESGRDRVKEALHPFRKKYHRPFNALNEVSFSIKKGERFGIIGENGSGKSTLVQIVAGVLSPTSGDLVAKGRIAALLELGAGFNPELTGRENVYLNGTILGMNREEIDNKFSAIEAFADIGTFLDQPVKTYSSGMFVRLAFSIASSVDPDILIVDEALAVGDIYFQHKCMHRMKSMMDKRVTTIFVSHDMLAVRALCDRAILLEHGRVRAIGKSEDVVNKYIHRMVEDEPRHAEDFSEIDKITQESSASSKPQKEINCSPRTHTGNWVFERNDSFLNRTSSTRAGSGEARIQNVMLLNEKGVKNDRFALGDWIQLRIFIEFFQDVGSVNVGFVVRNRNGAEPVGTNCNLEKIFLRNKKKGTCMAVDFLFRNLLRQGSYSVSTAVGVSDGRGIRNMITLDWVDNAVVFVSEKDPEYHLHTLVKIPVQISILE